MFGLANEAHCSRESRTRQAEVVGHDDGRFEPYLRLPSRMAYVNVRARLLSGEEE
jgi:hypothetical protein